MNIRGGDDISLNKSFRTKRGETMSYSIFVRDLSRTDTCPAQLLAYDIQDRQEAQSIISLIATSYRDHGFNPATRVHWFRRGDSVHAIYAWPQT
ncbi:hypothetical protein ACRAWG_12415 [Methylobacterium sp. P31]